MFKKFNWGHGIFVFYVCFVAAVVTALVASFSVDHSLVVDDYYAKDLAYQSQYTKTQNNLNKQGVTVDNDKKNKEILIDFISTGKVEGSINFYRPSDKSKDFTVKIKEDKIIISTADLLPGKWVLKIDWKEDGKPFYSEELIYI
ncbi:MAG: FixH family protein [Saprospiraceae bacterium]|nr:FixH family protein [Saprospiraceae bacterium]